MTAVAVLGTGRMGSSMARALARAGHQLVLYNRTADRAQELADELGARVAPAPGEAVEQVEVGLTMLADGNAVEEIYHQPDGVLSGVRDGVVLLEMSTAEPRVSRSLAPEVRRRGGELLDAPVSGSVALAEQGRLTIMAGGAADALERAKPVLEAMAARVFHLGEVGTGAAMKLAVNAVIFALDVALSEALVLAERAGIERTTAYDVLEASAVGAPFVGYKRPHFLDPEAAPVGFSLELAEKDLRLIAALAESVGLPMAQTRTNLDLIRAAAQSEGSESDFARVATHLRNRSA
ncbi:MAG: NAD(P)-dependent oxidoreductase [Chloroflexota bacterium]|nr:NAD(P)-dependent oxidoreductase [Chloroflexota bacterium]